VVSSEHPDRVKGESNYSHWKSNVSQQD